MAERRRIEISNLAVRPLEEALSAARCAIRPTGLLPVSARTQQGVTPLSGTRARPARRMLPGLRLEDCVLSCRRVRWRSSFRRIGIAQTPRRRALVSGPLFPSFLCHNSSCFPAQPPQFEPEPSGSARRLASALPFESWRRWPGMRRQGRQSASSSAHLSRQTP